LTALQIPDMTMFTAQEMITIHYVTCIPHVVLRVQKMLPVQN
jgi:hypothetical protein